MVATIDDILKRAVHEKSGLRLTALGGTQSTHAARALEWSEAPSPEGLWVHLPDADENTIARFGTALPAVSVTFAFEGTRYQFDSNVLSRNRRFWINDTVMVDALLVAAPPQVRRIEERRKPRLPVSETSGISAQLIRLCKSASAIPDRSALVPVEAKLQDLSLVGAGFVCAPDRTLLAAQRGERLACVIDFRGRKIVLVASLARVVSVSSRAMRVGVDFAAHENEKAMAGKLAELANVVQELERQNSLRRR
ncbi:MAG TPA: hypothetical protein VGR35_22000 [Tepidisphaeraceae bacterium]|nr:hypothetical protein [Tepidisphaeraceae bacterium]